MSEEEAKKRLALIAKKQELLGKAVGTLQERLFEAVLNQIETIAEDPAAMNRLFDEFTQNEHAKVLQSFAKDILSIGQLNAEYFIEAAANIGSKDYAAIQTKANDQILSRFGLSKEGKMLKGGFIDSFANDPTIKRELTQYAYKAKTSGAGLQEFKKGFRELIVGGEGKKGKLERYYQTFAVDTYNQVDATLQKQYADELKLQAALYLGGTIAGTRDFCRLRNGRVFARFEIEKFGTSKDTYGGYTNKSTGEFSGKDSPYEPFTSRGGWQCRHQFNFITNKMALSRRPDLEEADGKLRVKGTGPKEPEFTPAKTIKEAEEFARVNNLAKKVDYSKVTLEAANKTNEIFAEMKGKGLNAEIEIITDLKSLYKQTGRKYTETTKGVLAQAVAMGEKKYFGLGETFKDNNAVQSYLSKLDSRDIIKKIDLNGVMYHEYGHLMDYSNRLNQFETINAELKERYFEHIEKIGFKSLAEKQIREDVGSYMLVNDAEFFAEGFRLWQSKTTPKNLSFIDDYFNAKFKK